MRESALAAVPEFNLATTQTLPQDGEQRNGLIKGEEWLEFKTYNKPTKTRSYAAHMCTLFDLFQIFLMIHTR